MHVDSDGWLVNDPGDVGTVVKLPRTAGKYGQDYGPIKTGSGKPIIFVHHATGTYSKEGADSSDKDGTAGMAKRVASGNVRYYAHVYLGRDGKVYQMVPFTRAALSVEGTFKFNVPPEAKGKENNKIAASMEWTGWGGSQKLLEKAGITAKLSDRPDMKKQGGFYWQIPTMTQVRAGIEATKAVQQWAGMNPEAAFYGHKEIGSGAHGDPGPILTTILDVLGRPALGLVPKAATAFFPFGEKAAEAAKAAAKQVVKAGKAIVETGKTHPRKTLLLVGGIVAGVALLVRRRRRSFGDVGFLPIFPKSVYQPRPRPLRGLGCGCPRR